jgi:hypothetical protein
VRFLFNFKNEIYGSWLKTRTPLKLHLLRHVSMNLSDYYTAHAQVRYIKWKRLLLYLFFEKRLVFSFLSLRYVIFFSHFVSFLIFIPFDFPPSYFLFPPHISLCIFIFFVVVHSFRSHLHFKPETLPMKVWRTSEAYHERLWHVPTLNLLGQRNRFTAPAEKQTRTP